MKRIVLILVLAASSSAFAQEKTAGEYYNDGVKAYSSNLFVEGLESFKKAIEMNEAAGTVDSTFYFNAGTCAYKAEKFEEAVLYFGKSIEFNHKADNAYLYKGLSLKKLERLDEMEQVLEEGYLKYPKSKAAENYKKTLGQHYAKKGIEIYNEAVKLKTDAINLESAKDEDGAKAKKEEAKLIYEKALPFLEKSYEYIPDQEVVNKALTDCYGYLEMPEKAKSLGN